jgi:hypothetical protein
MLNFLGLKCLGRAVSSVSLLSRGPFSVSFSLSSSLVSSRFRFLLRLFRRLRGSRLGLGLQKFSKGSFIVCVRYLEVALGLVMRCLGVRSKAPRISDALRCAQCEVRQPK